MNRIFFILLFLPSVLLNAQSAPIAIDGKFDDWGPSLATYTDAVESISGIDLLEFQVSNDDEYLFLHFILDTEIALTDNLIDHNVRLYLDTDNDSSTGFTGAQTGFGSEIGIIFKDRFAYFNVTPFSTIGFSDFNLRKEVTTTGVEFEIAIGRNVIPDGINPLFTSNTINVLFVETTGNDEMPNLGETFSYTFDDTPVTPYAPITLEKDNADYIRVMAYNSLNHLDDVGIQDDFERIFLATNPDIIGFSEASGISAIDVKILFDTWLPLGTANGWYSVKDDYDMITVSKWPIIDSWDGLDRQFATLIDLPVSYSTDFLFVSAHLKCCSNGDIQRQAQVDEFASFILDAKSPGGIITIPENTPFVFCGDMNLVGLAQQYETVITGDIQDTGTYGPAGFLDWDGSDLTDACPLIADERMGYTWRNDASEFAPSRLDFFFYSDAVMSIPKAYSLKTNIMSPTRLSTYGLNASDTENASDHLPIIMDMSLVVLLDSDSDGISDNSDNCPNIFNPLQEDWNNNGIGDHCEDSDGDTLIDYDEIVVYGTDPGSSDTDFDSLTDGAEINILGTDPTLMDTDGDGLTDGLEVGFGITNALLFDSDGDGCDDASFFNFQCPGQSTGTDTCPVDTDGNGQIDILDLINISSSFGTTCE